MMKKISLVFVLLALGAFSDLAKAQVNTENHKISFSISSAASVANWNRGDSLPLLSLGDLNNTPEHAEAQRPNQDSLRPIPYEFFFQEVDSSSGRKSKSVKPRNNFTWPVINRDIMSTLTDRRVLLRCGLLFIAGGAEGTAEILKYNPDKYASFWRVDINRVDPNVTWRNKYKNGDPLQGPKFLGSTGPFVGFTDPYHAFRLIRNAGFMGSIIIPLERRKSLVQYATELGMYYLAFGLGFESQHGWLYNTK